MANPLMSEAMYLKIGTDTENSMTLEGTINKSLFLVTLTILSAIGVWNYVEIFLPFTFIIVIANFILGLIIIFYKKSSPILAPIYAILEGLVIGVISLMFEKDFPGIVLQAVSLTFGIFVVMLLLYKSRIVKATENFKTGLIAATGAIALIYLISFIGNLSGWYNVPFIHESGIIGIGFSAIVVFIASLNLILDFDNVEKGVELKSPKYMEWYTSFGLLVTLIWLYLEILRLLGKLRK